MTEALTAAEEERLTAYLDARDGLFMEYLDAGERARLAFLRYLVKTGRLIPEGRE